MDNEYIQIDGMELQVRKHVKAEQADHNPRDVEMQSNLSNNSPKQSRFNKMISN